jgi:hypothetical protein
MKVPRADTTPCVACNKPIVFARTSSISKGAPKLLGVDGEPDNDGKVLLTLTGEHYYAGKIKYNQRQGMIAAGLQFHTAHNDTCPKKDEYIRKRKGQWKQ